MCPSADLHVRKLIYCYTVSWLKPPQSLVLNPHFAMSPKGNKAAGSKETQAVAKNTGISSESVADSSFAARLSKMIGKLKYVPTSKKASEEEKEDIAHICLLACTFQCRVSS